MRRARAWFVGVCMLAGSSSALAQARPETDRWTAKRLAIEGHLAVNAPVGLLGVALDFSAARWLALNAGFGAGADGGQLALSVRPRLAFHAIAWGLDLGWSTGRHTYDRCGFFHIDCEETEYGEWRSAHWLNVGASFEYRALGGFVLRVFGGGGPLLNTGAGICEDDLGASSCPDQSRGFFGVALGYAADT